MVLLYASDYDSDYDSVASENQPYYKHTVTHAIFEDNDCSAFLYSANSLQFVTGSFYNSFVLIF